MNEIHPEVDNGIGRWVLEDHHIYNPYSGVTNNQSESLNKLVHYINDNFVNFYVSRVIKELQEWKEAPIDCMVLALYLLQAFYFNEIRRGMAGLGEYTLCEKYKCASIESFDIQYLTASSPADIVKNIRENKLTDTVTSTSHVDTPHDDMATEATSNVVQQEKDDPKRKASANIRAQHILQADNISYDTKLRVFLVKGTSATVRTVTMFPKATCSCPSMCECYHILAVKLSLGMVAKEKSKKELLNLTQLRKNTRSRKERKSGRKRPRPKE